MTDRDQTMNTVLAVLGDFADDFTRKRGTDGLDDLCRVLESIDETYPDEDVEARTNAFNGAQLLGFGDDTLKGLADELYRARQAELTAMETLVGAIKWAAIAEGMSEAQIVAETGLARNTIRKAMP